MARMPGCQAVSKPFSISSWCAMGTPSMAKKSEIFTKYIGKRHSWICGPPPTVGPSLPQQAPMAPVLKEPEGLGS